MKLKVKKLLYISLTILLSMGFFATGLFAQDTGPSEPPGDPSEGGGGPIGGSAPIASGLTILLTLGAAYGGARTYHLVSRKKDKE
ncbi:MAG: hypothetical protein P8100_05095 [bacterium]